MMRGEEKQSGFNELARDLNALLKLLKVAQKEVPIACHVPEWDNHLDDNGEPKLLGDVASTYHLWVEDAGIEHDGACQVAELADSLRLTINELDKIADAN
jgi:hypothetical protein